MTTRIWVTQSLKSSEIPPSNVKSARIRRTEQRPVEGEAEGEREVSPIHGLCDTANEADYDLVSVPLTNRNWQTRFETYQSPGSSNGKSLHDAFLPTLDKGGDAWRSGPHLFRSEVHLCHLSEAERCGSVRLSPWLPIAHISQAVRSDAQLALAMESAYAVYLGVLDIVLPSPLDLTGTDPGPSGLAGQDYLGPSASAAWADCGRCIAALLAAHKYTNFVLPFAISAPYLTSSHSATGSVLSTSTQPLSQSAQQIEMMVDRDASALLAWEAWETIRIICDNDPRLSLALELPHPYCLPSTSILARWHAQPLRHIIIPATAFLTNSKGFPVLSKALQIFVKDCIKAHSSNPDLGLSQATTLQIVVSGTGSASIQKSSQATAKSYAAYIRHLLDQATVEENQSILAEKMAWKMQALDFEDRLQAPLQPLMDNLDSGMYDIFERDERKYEIYGSAIFSAIGRKTSLTRSMITIFIVGAGRGAIVQKAVEAADRHAVAGTQCTIYAIEKNPNAFMTLQQKKGDPEGWGSRVELIFGDMRTWQPPNGLRADVLVSELLGSFGDNELSPECLDGAQRLLKVDGISIPSSYSSWVTPVSSPRLHQRAGQVQSNLEQMRKSFETPWVVHMKSVHFPACEVTRPAEDGTDSIEYIERAKYQEAWSFQHPNARSVLSSNLHNHRTAHLTFLIPHKTTIHGLAGFFEAMLFENSAEMAGHMVHDELSTHPERHSEKCQGMFSWFPMYFPFKEALYVPSGGEIDVHIYRLSDKTKVWYEWQAEVYLPLALSTGAATSMNGSATMPSLASRRDLVNHNGGVQVGGQEDILYERIKVGQTALHNPSGRSSWVGLA